MHWTTSSLQDLVFKEHGEPSLHIPVWQCRKDRIISNNEAPQNTNTSQKAKHDKNKCVCMAFPPINLNWDNSVRPHGRCTRPFNGKPLPSKCTFVYLHACFDLNRTKITLLSVMKYMLKYVVSWITNNRGIRLVVVFQNLCFTNTFDMKNAQDKRVKK